MLVHMAEYCDTPESKDRSNREYKACLREELYHVYSTKNGMIDFCSLQVFAIQ